MKIIGIGNALLDVLLRLESDETLALMGVKKGAMDLIDESGMREIQKAQSGLQRFEAPGGSVCNTMRALASLGAEVGYIGKIGNDDAGRFYEAETEKAGVDTFFVRTEGISGCSTVLISPDGERTMTTFLGPAATLADGEIPDEILQKYDCIYIEGYLISNEKLFLPILKRAKNAGLKIALDLSNFNIVNGFRDMLKEVVPAYVDILFSNESEAEAYTGRPALESSAIIAKEVEISVVTVGKDGVLVSSNGKTVHQAALECNVVDTTGAGDNFAAGFLYGYSNRATLEQSAEIGASLSANVIETVGAQIFPDRWAKIKMKVSDILRLLA
ncbi:MAG: adenosine kinase [Tannerella sp.]|jgi:sugar/nucleoside kinase (ribokinase family)|nr:adenosine kinase [Tannerella sp.]